MTRRRLISWYLAVAAALVALLLWVWLVSDPTLRPAASSTPPAAGSGTGSAATTQPEDNGSSDDPVTQLVDQQSAQVAALSSEEQFQKLQRHANQVAGLSPRSVEQIATLFESSEVVGDLPQRAYEPREDVAGEFDHETTSLYDMEARQGPEGVIYVWTLVDAQGRTMRVEVPDEQMRPEDRMAARVFDLARTNPNMRRLLDSVRKLAESRIVSTQPATQPAEAPIEQP